MTMVMAMFMVVVMMIMTMWVDMPMFEMLMKRAGDQVVEQVCRLYNCIVEDARAINAKDRHNKGLFDYVLQ